MKLERFFATVGPYLAGRAPHAATVHALYGEGADAGGARLVDARRLAVYGRFCRVHRFEVVDGIYHRTRAAVLARGGEPAWSSLVEAFFREHPMRHFELNANGAALAEFLTQQAAGLALPPWLAELADFEWWEWQSEVALDDAGDAEPAGDPGPLRLASTVELRPYRHDLVAWLDDEEDDARPAEPAAQATIVVFWRDRDLDSRRENATPIELAVLKMVSEGLAPGALAGLSLPRTALKATLADLREAGILLGRSP